MKQTSWLWIDYICYLHIKQHHNAFIDQTEFRWWTFTVYSVFIILKTPRAHFSLVNVIFGLEGSWNLKVNCENGFVCFLSVYLDRYFLSFPSCSQTRVLIIHYQSPNPQESRAFVFTPSEQHLHFRARLPLCKMYDLVSVIIFCSHKAT